MKIIDRISTGAALILICCSLSTACSTDTRESNLNALIESERDFSRSAAELGTRDAFIAYLAADGILFRPRAVNAQEDLASRESTPGLLSWGPAFADISEAGDLGFTTGPWEFRQDPAAEAIAFGNYFSFWKLQDDGSWKVALDHGISNSPPAQPPEEVVTPERPRYDDRWALWPRQRQNALDRLLEIDRAFSAASVADGLVASLTSYVSSDVRVLRNGMQPETGAEKLRALAADLTGTFLWEPQGGDVSLSGDLGYTYGEWAYSAPDSEATTQRGIYVKAWRRVSDESWRVIVDVLTPFEPVAPN
jgi:ketosteroid isomerase-like protein